MERIKLLDMQPGNIYKTDLLLRETTEKKDKNGRPYLVLRVGDGESEADLFLWENAMGGFTLKPGAVMTAQVAVNLFNGRSSYNLKSFQENPFASVKDFIQGPPVDPELLYAECLRYIDGIAEEGLRTLTRTIYEEQKDRLLRWSAAKTVHHSYPGGLLWHVVRMARTALCVCDNYEGLSRGLVMAGILLHDIGKLSEMNTTDLGVTDYTVGGELCGHLYLGAETVRKYAARLGTPQEDVRMLVHIILSHHGKPEYGAVVRPETMEAAVVHYVDLMDSHLFIYEKELEKMQPGEITDSNYFLDGAKVYRPKPLA